MLGSAPKLLVWRQEHVIGLPEIDVQHRGLVDLLNELHAAVQQAPEDLARGVNCFDRLVIAMLEHFAWEESMMRETGYPGLDDHLREHAYLMRLIAPIYNRVHSGMEAPHMAMLVFLREWLCSHLRSEDRKMAHFVSRKRRQAARMSIPLPA